MYVKQTEFSSWKVLNSIERRIRCILINIDIEMFVFLFKSIYISNYRDELIELI
jgi:hypothetical protein